MARTFTLSQLITRSKQRCDMENSGLISDSEWSGLISTAYGELYSELVRAGARYFERTRTISAIAATYASGTLTVVAKASLVQGETVDLDDGYGLLTFEIDVAGTGVSSGNVQVNVSADTTSTNVGATFEAAINAATHEDGRAFAITATNTAGSVALVHDETGEIGNQTCSESVAVATFAVTDMTGGGQTYRLPTDHLSTVGVFYVPNSSSEWITLTERMAQEHYRGSGSSGGYSTGWSVHNSFIRLTPFPGVGQTYKLRYVPQNPDLTGAPVSTKVDVVTPDGEAFIVSHVAVEALSKESSDVVGAVAARERMRARIIEWATLRSLHELRKPMVDDLLSGGDDDGDYRLGFGGL